MGKKNSKNSKKAKLGYIQLSATVFLDTYPGFAAYLPPSFVLELLSEPEYVVRFNPDTYHVEFGFSSDDWCLK
ncbi:hypothetical protein [Glycocaulis alkaliphilus]|uniref:hypothetical protein n=1 Tax=Glycocaulis alkaliphilus TaxID=1434191 RepID=UPI00166C8B6F|nr:hypothetical protein [Glycocaulis alkaliphilus]GGB87142.1 hypothetical protein GCM10007417_28970 [Glycocaulis alkaliphilus]